MVCWNQHANLAVVSSSISSLDTRFNFPRNTQNDTSFNFHEQVNDIDLLNETWPLANSTIEHSGQCEAFISNFNLNSRASNIVAVWCRLSSRSNPCSWIYVDQVLEFACNNAYRLRLVMLQQQDTTSCNACPSILIQMTEQFVCYSILTNMPDFLCFSINNK